MGIFEQQFEFFPSKSLSIDINFSNAVLGISSGIHEIGGIQWELFGYLMLAWVMVYLVIWKGLHNSGKVRLSFQRINKESLVKL